jgi:hypothetical protein
MKSMMLLETPTCRGSKGGREGGREGKAESARAAGAAGAQDVSERSGTDSKVE